MKNLQTLYKHLNFKNFKIIVIDRDFAFIKVIYKIFATIVNLLCI